MSDFNTVIRTGSPMHELQKKKAQTERCAQMGALLKDYQYAKALGLSEDDLKSYQEEVDYEEVERFASRRKGRRASGRGVVFDGELIPMRDTFNTQKPGKTGDKKHEEALTFPSPKEDVIMSAATSGSGSVSKSVAQASFAAEEAAKVTSVKSEVDELRHEVAGSLTEAYTAFDTRIHGLTEAVRPTYRKVGMERGVELGGALAGATIAGLITRKVMGTVSEEGGEALPLSESGRSMTATASVGGALAGGFLARLALGLFSARKASK